MQELGQQVSPRQAAQLRQRHKVRDRVFAPLGKFGIVVRQSQDGGPHVGCRRSAALEDLEHLIAIFLHQQQQQDSNQEIEFKTSHADIM